MYFTKLGDEFLCDACAKIEGFDPDLRIEECFSESDWPTGCANCGEFLDEKLTGDGEREAARMLGDAIRKARRGEIPKEGVQRNFVLSLASGMQYSYVYAALGKLAIAETLRAIEAIEGNTQNLQYLS